MIKHYFFTTIITFSIISSSFGAQQVASKTPTAAQQEFEELKKGFGCAMWACIEVFHKHAQDKKLLKICFDLLELRINEIILFCTTNEKIQMVEACGFLQLQRLIKARDNNIAFINKPGSNKSAVILLEIDRLNKLIYELLFHILLNIDNNK